MFVPLKINGIGDFLKGGIILCCHGAATYLLIIYRRGFFFFLTKLLKHCNPIFTDLRNTVRVSNRRATGTYTNKKKLKKRPGVRNELTIIIDIRNDTRAGFRVTPLCVSLKNQ